ncbi:cyclin-T1-3-like [Cucurbita maxima]|uniref:B-like cyclin n=1 Tax=Cucurbita maxima TaxID=3661 RepID=A0A6J1K9E4_CUCMA|nr:cyclin-T1-3-like [Cucurbita maxima]XP_022996679.1 cyclin-T1-3-like [Cucurbita maxima]
MARQLPQNHLENAIPGTTPSHCVQEEHLISARKWYFSRQEIENHSPSRKDGVDFKKESQLRKSYCLFLQELGMKLKVPQVTIASAMMVCHRFYMCQSHAKNDWQTIGTAGIFLACKIEETPRFLNDVVVVAFELIFKRDSSASKRIRQKEVFNKQKELVLISERLILSTLAFDVDIQLPYKPLVATLKKLGMAADLGKVAWNFVNDWLYTTLCLEYKPHYIAAGSIFLASKFQKVKLPSNEGKAWWMEFDVSPKQLQEVIQQMLKLFEKDRKQSLPPSKEKNHKPEALDGQTRVDSSQSCISSVTISDHLDSHKAIREASDCNKSVTPSRCHNQQNVNYRISPVEVLPCQTSDTGSSSSAIDNGDTGICQNTEENYPDQIKQSKTVAISMSKDYKKINLCQIREAIKRRRLCRTTSTTEVQPMNSDVDSEAWIEKELEQGIELEYESSLKKRQKAS